MASDLLAALFKRRSRVDSLAETFESAPAESGADAKAGGAEHLVGLAFDAPDAQRWLQQQATPEEDRVAELLAQELETRGLRPAHVPFAAAGAALAGRGGGAGGAGGAGGGGPTCPPEEQLQELEKAAEEARQERGRLARELERLQRAGSELEEREAAAAAKEELVAERERALDEARARAEAAARAAAQYPQPEWLECPEGTANVAVVGESGVGKSLLINKIRHAQPGSEKWAPVGVSETTMEPTMYAFPNEPRVRLWDLPGAGTTAFPRERYVATMGLRYFDAVLVVSAARFTETEVALAEELEAHGVPRFMVRTKADIDVWNNKEDNSVDEAATLDHILSDLRRRGVAEAYLVSSREPERFDLRRLVRDIFPSLRALPDGALHGAADGWDDAWALPEASSALLARVQGRWTNGFAEYYVHGKEVHVTRPNGTCAVAALEEADGKLMWARCWYVDDKAVGNALNTGELTWTPNLQAVKSFSWKWCG